MVEGLWQIVTGPSQLISRVIMMARTLWWALFAAATATALVLPARRRGSPRARAVGGEEECVALDLAPDDYSKWGVCVSVPHRFERRRTGF